MGFLDRNFSKKQLLIMSLFFDFIGMSSYLFPFLDVVWAPLSAWLMTKLHKDNLGKVGGIISFLEEALPVIDFFPSFTMVWFYRFYIRKK
ncbi:MAG: hypothetical protein U5K51_15225 [Flavobacteriaceae bacterium]|nr:hypothetical protein [Flavobacteriaceae bacterium]